MRGITNPIVPGWYADPEARFYLGEYWIYATRSHTDYTKQLNLDAFSSKDLIHWDKHSDIIDMSGFPWVWRAVWAPTIIQRGPRFYLLFASNDIASDREPGGLEIAVSDSPSGPFTACLGQPLVGCFIHGAQPIDAHLFEDDDGTVYLYYGGWGHCNVARMNEEMTGFIPAECGAAFKEITPEGYVEGPCMIKKDGLYYFMWSCGSWSNGTYRVDYGVSNCATGPFQRKGTLLESQAGIAEGPGHHGYLQMSDDGGWLIVYHRRIIGEPDPGSRILCIDRLEIGSGEIAKVKMTNRW